MLAYRSHWMIKPGRLQEAVDLLRAEVERVGAERYSVPGAGEARIYTPDTGEDTLVFETTFTDAEANTAFWARYNEAPEASAPFWQKWNELVQGPASHELLRLTECS